MGRAASTLGRSNMNDFLFAAIGIQANGMPLSVVSAMARQGIDPWHEAERLAMLPRSDAIALVTDLIAMMPQSTWPKADAKAIAARLVDLLPPRSDDAFRSENEAALRRSGVMAPIWPVFGLTILFVAAFVAAAAELAPPAPGPSAAKPIATQLPPAATGP